jgi:hypothetical protein
MAVLPDTSSPCLAHSVFQTPAAGVALLLVIRARDRKHLVMWQFCAIPVLLKGQPVYIQHAQAAIFAVQSHLS